MISARPSPISEAKLQANRANARHSTGPQTEEGKANSSQNNFRHGLAAVGSFQVLPGEDQAAFDTMLAGLRDEYLPRTKTQELLVDRMAQSWWLAQRAQNIIEFEIATRGSFDPAPLTRYQTMHERAFHRAAQELRAMYAESRRDTVTRSTLQSRKLDEQRKAELHQLRIAKLTGKLQTPMPQQTEPQPPAAPEASTVEPPIANAEPQLESNAKTAARSVTFPKANGPKPPANSAITPQPSPTPLQSHAETQSTGASRTPGAHRAA